eukprot:CFRG8073T1
MLDVGVPVHLNWVFSSKSVSSDGLGWFGTGVYFMNACVSSVWILLVVARTKLCLDFCVTLYVYHFMFCFFYSGWPTLWWWACTFGCCTVTTMASEALCVKKEMKEIPVIGVGNKNDV